MKKEERIIYYDTDLQVEVYEFKGIAQKFGNHFHEGYVIGLVEAGVREFVCNNNHYTLNAGDILLINPQEIHGCEQFGDDDLHYFSFNISTDTMRRVMTEITGKASLPHFNESVIRLEEIELSLYDLKDMILTEHQDFKKEETFLFLMERLVNDYSEPVTVVESEKAPEQIEKICQYLETHFFRNITLDELSLAAGFSKYYLLRTFTKVKGISPHKYLETIRIEKSKKMLEEGLPIIDIALRTGFTDQSHFTNLFKSLIGLTPKSYQKVIKEVGNMEGKV